MRILRVSADFLVGLQGHSTRKVSSALKVNSAITGIIALKVNFALICVVALNGQLYPILCPVPPVL